MCDHRLDRSKSLCEELCKKYPECPALWKYFVSLTEVARPSGSTRAAQKWAADIGAKLGGTVKTDAAGNVAIAFPATPGKENVPGVVLQAHLDMVPTKSADHVHNFAEDPIHAFVDGELLRARNTTLGADDGSGIAAALAIAEDKKLVHGPIELLFTVDEEVGLVGALALKEGELLSEKAKYLVNIDSEEWGEITLSCAGGVDRMLHIPLATAPHDAGWQHMSLTLRDFKGGHTGVEIHVGRANAIKWATAMMLENCVAQAGCPFRVSKLDGGNAHNAIPSHVHMEFAVPADRCDAFVTAASDVFHMLNLRWSHIEKTAEKEPRFEFKKLPAPTMPVALTLSSSRTAFRFLESVHHGIWKWSEEVPTLVETSQSMSTVSLKDNSLNVEVYARSSKNEVLAALSKFLEASAELFGGKSTPRSEDSPGWPAEPDSTLCKTAAAVYKQMFGTDAKLVPIHAGLECGIIINKFPKNKIEAISVGPTIRSPHTVDEQMSLPSAVSLYRFLFHLVEALAK